MIKPFVIICKNNAERELAAEKLIKDYGLKLYLNRLSDEKKYSNITFDGDKEIFCCAHNYEPPLKRISFEEFYGIDDEFYY